jgi:hypothetical protein
VITQDAKTALPLKDLTREESQVFDNASKVRSFDVGARYAARPIALWFVVICNQVDRGENGSGFIRGKGQLLRPALDRLDKNETIGWPTGATIRHKKLILRRRETWMAR